METEKSYRVIITTRYIYYLDIIQNVRQAISCLLHKDSNVPRKNLAVKRQLIGRDEVLPVSVMSKLPVFRATERVE